MRIPRNSSDIVAKEMTLACPGSTLEVIGISGVNVIRALPTEIDRIDIRQEFTDVVLEQRNGEILHLEFQTSREPTLYRFLSYDGALADKFRRKIRTVVLYTGDVHSAPETLDIGSAQYHVENVFLNRLDGDSALETVERHLQANTWEEEDRIRLAFAFQMRFTKYSRDEAFEKVLDIANRIPSPEEQNYVTAVILGLSGRNLSLEQKNRLKEAMQMTDIVKEIEREAEERAVQRERREIAIDLLREGMPVTKVAKISRLTEQEIEALQKKLQ